MQQRREEALAAKLAVRLRPYYAAAAAAAASASSSASSGGGRPAVGRDAFAAWAEARAPVHPRRGLGSPPPILVADAKERRPPFCASHLHYPGPIIPSPPSPRPPTFFQAEAAALTSGACGVLFGRAVGRSYVEAGFLSRAPPLSCPLLSSGWPLSRGRFDLFFGGPPLSATKAALLQPAPSGCELSQILPRPARRLPRWRSALSWRACPTCLTSAPRRPRVPAPRWLRRGRTRRPVARARRR